MKKILALAVVAVLTICTVLALTTSAFADDWTTQGDAKTTAPTTAAPVTVATTTAAPTTVTTTAAETTTTTTVRATEVNATTVPGQTLYEDVANTAAPTGSQASVDEPIVQTGSASSIAVFSILAIAGAAFIVTKTKKN